MKTAKRKRHDIMLAHPFRMGKLVSWPYYVVQPKIDGIRCRAIYSYEGGVQLVSSTGRDIITVPHIERELAERMPELASRFEGYLELDGELHSHNWSRTASLVNRGSIHPDHEEVTFYVFDLIDEQATQMTRTSTLVSHFYFGARHCPLLHTYQCQTIEEVWDMCSQFMREGWEGIIIRHPEGLYERRRSFNMFKYKPAQKDSYKIIGWMEEKDKNGELKGRLGALICTDPEGHKFRVGSGLDDEGRARLWNLRERLPGMTAVVKYQELTESKSPRFPVVLEVTEDVDIMEVLEDDN